MKVKAVGERLLIKLIPKEKIREEKSEGGILLKAVQKTDKQLQQEQESISIGYVVAMGQDAYADKKEPWCKVGDCIQMSRYSGMLVENVEEDVVYRMINDIDVQAVFPEGPL